MYIDNENFEKWMDKLSKKLTEIGQDLKSIPILYSMKMRSYWIIRI